MSLNVCIKASVTSRGGYSGEFSVIFRVDVIGHIVVEKLVCAFTVFALICIFMKAGMALGGVIPGLVLAWVGFDAAAKVQAPLAEQGILWLVTLIPAALFTVAIFIIGKYELSDERMDEINMEIAKRR